MAALTTGSTHRIAGFPRIFRRKRNKLQPKYVTRLLSIRMIDSRDGGVMSMGFDDGFCGENADCF
jgi:hypothetical protein